MSTIRLKNVSSTNWFFSELGSEDSRGRLKGKKVGCVPGSNIFVTDEEEIKRCDLLQRLIVEKKLIPIDSPQPSIVRDSQKMPKTQEIPQDSDDRFPAVDPHDSINLIAGSEEDAKELQDYLDSNERQETAKSRDVVTQQPYAYEADVPKEKQSVSPDPKGSSGLDLFYQQPPRNIMVDDYQKPPSNLYPEDQKKN